jgi:hypothetical protein
MAKKAATTVKRRTADNNQAPTKPGVNWSKISKNIGKRWKESRKKEFGGGGEFDNLPIRSGEFFARLSEASYGTYKSGNNKGEPYLRLGFIALFSDADGEKFSLPYTINANSAGYKDKDGNEVLNYETILRDLKRLGIDIASLDFEDLTEVVADLTKNRPYVSMYCQNKKKRGEKYDKVDEHGPRKDDYYQNMYINGTKTHEEMELAAKEYGEQLPEH